MDKPSDYAGPRDAAGIVSYVEKAAGPPSKELRTTEEVCTDSLRSMRFGCRLCMSWAFVTGVALHGCWSLALKGAEHSQGVCTALLQSMGFSHWLCIAELDWILMTGVHGPERITHFGGFGSVTMSRLFHE